MRAAVSVLFLLAALFACTAVGQPVKSSRLGKYVTLCRVSDAELDKCMVKAIQDLLKYSKTGIPELRIPPFEPFVIEELDLKIFQGLGDSLFGRNIQRNEKSRSFARNLIAHHSSEFIMHSLKADIEKKQFYIDMSFPKLNIEGEYDVNTQMFNIPIKSTGPVFINATDISVKATLNGKTIKKKEETYLLFDSIDIKVDFKDYSVFIDNVFKKDQNLNRALNDMIKNQKTELRKLMMPMIEEVAGKMVLNMANQILNGLPYEEIFITD
ncbi:Haemolymph juvenile hormone binding [Cinara cedri]|uniref:Haemolymph juvenile hormone binding n=1 Tax=Cinara cedri TaxID=506608 RepID=A0A5E4N2F2_9HEMI|nr:Haemolymph juvenile hormone binding [Cinara cedri]